MALTERLQVLLEAIGGSQVSAEFSKVGKDASKTYADIQKGATAAGNETTKFGGLTSNMSNVAKTAFTVVGTAIAVGLVDAVKKGVQSYVELGTQSLQLQRITGGSAQQVSGFAAVLRTLGVSSGDAAKPLGLLASNIATHSDKFTQAGVAIAHYKDGTTDILGTLDNLRTKFQETSDATQRDALAKTTLGRGYQTLLPYLTATNEQVAEFKRQAEAHGEILTQDDIEKARQFQIAVTELKQGVAQFERDLASGLVPTLTAVAKTSDTVIGSIDHLTRSVGGLGGFFKSVVQEIPGIGALVTATGGLSSSSKDTSSSTDALSTALDGVGQAALVADSAEKTLKSTEDGVASSAKNLRSAQESLAQSHQAVEKAVQGVTKAQEGLQTAHQGVQRAQESLADAQQRLNDLLAKGAVDAQQVADAEKSLESATRGVQHAQESLADAQKTLNEALAGATPDELTDAQLALQRATLGVAQAQQQVNQANAPHAGRTGLEAQQAQLGLTEAIQAQHEAQEKLDAEKARGSAQDPAVISAQRGVRDAVQQVADAIDNENTAAAKLREAQAGDPSFNDQVAAAKRGVRDASDALTTAQRGERDAAAAVRDAQQAVVDAKDREVEASYNVRDANYNLIDSIQAINDNNLNQLQIVDDLIARYPELQGVLANYQAQAAASGGINPNQLYQGVFGTVTGAQLLQLPHFAEGGWVPGATGQSVPAILHGQEFVLSREMIANMGRGGGGSVIVNVAGSVVSERDLIEIVHRAINKPGGRYNSRNN